MKVKFLAIAFMAVLSLFLFASENINIEKIIFDPNDSNDVLKAVQEFKKYYAIVSGLHLNTENGDLKSAYHALILGKAAVKSGIFSQQELASTGKFGGYRIREKNGCIFIAGDTAAGTLYGTYKLLEKMGCRFYVATHEVMPSSINLNLQGLDLLEKPFYELRQIDNYYEKNGQHAISQRVPRLDFEPGFPVIHWDHTALGLVRPELYGQAHPEYYMQDASGQRAAAKIKNVKDFYTNGMQLCFSNKDVRDIAGKKLIAWMDVQPENIYYNITQNDGYSWCMCGECQKLDTVPGKVTTDRVINFVNSVAKLAAEKNPDKIITSLAYTSYTAPAPEKNAPLKNVRVFLCPYPPEIGDKGHWFDHKYNREFMPWYQDWIKKYPDNLYIYEYPFVCWELFSFPHEQMFFRLKQYAKDGVRGIHFCGRPMFMTSLFEYVTGKLVWNPDNQVEPLVKDFINSYYGAAAPQIQNVYNNVKEICAKSETIQGTARPEREILTIDEASKLLNLYDNAEAAVKNNDLQLARVRTDKLYVLRTFLENYNPVAGTAKDINLFKTRLGEYLRLVQETKGRLVPPGDFTIKDQQSVKNWFWSTAGLKIEASDWKKDPIVIQLMNDPKKVSISACSPVTQVKQLENGWLIPLERTKGTEGVIDYNWQCKPAQAIVIRNGSTNYSSMKVDFDLPLIPPDTVLELIAQDDDKPGATHILIKLNDHKINQGPNPFNEKEWTTHAFKIPEGVLKIGRNELEIRVLDEGCDFFTKWLALHCIKVITSQKLNSKTVSLIFSASYKNTFDADFSKGINKPAYAKKFTIKDGSLDAGCDASSAAGEFGYAASGNFNPAAGTIELEVNPVWDINNDDNSRTFIDLRGPDNRYGFLLYKHNKQKTLSLLIYNPEVSKRTILVTDISKWTPGQWHKLAFSWDNKSGTVNLLVDGKQEAEAKGLDIGKEMSEWLFVGSLKGYGKSAGAFIRNLNVYNQPVTL